MARVARDHLAAAEVRAIDLGHHRHHPARRALFRIGVDGIHVPASVARGVAILAGEAEGGRKNAHRAHELVDGNALEHLNVLEHLFGHGRLLLHACLTTNRRNTHQRHDRQSGGSRDRLRRHDLHAGAPSSRLCERPYFRLGRADRQRHYALRGTPRNCVLIASLFQSAAGSDEYTIAPLLITCT